MSGITWQDVGTGPAVVLLHAFPCDHRMWSEQVGAIENAGWRALVPDLPGFGTSSLVTEQPALGAVVESLQADLLERGVDRFVLVGLSVGGYLAMEWLRRSPEMIAALVLCDTKATIDSEQARAGRLAMASAVLEEPDRAAQILEERMLAGLLGPTTRGLRPAVVARVRQWLDAAPVDTIAWFQQAMANRVDSVKTLEAAEIPVTVIWGVEDGMSPREEQEILLAALRDGALVEIPEAGHLSAIENPSAVTEALLRFLADVRGATLQG